MIDKIVKFTGIKKEIINEIGVYSLFNNTVQLKLHKVTDIQYNKLCMLKELIQDYLECSVINEKIKGNSSTKIGEYLIKYFKTKHDKEHFVMICLNAHNEIISTKVLGVGNVDTCVIYNREVIKTALFENATSVILAHNHPAGSLTPSQNDLALHKKLKQSFMAVNIKLVDNMIITLGAYLSFGEKGMM